MSIELNSRAERASLRPYTFDRVVRIILVAISIIGALYILDRLSGVFLPFVVAWLIAYLLNPTVLFFQNRVYRGRRILAIATTLLSVVVVITLFFVMLTPSIISEFGRTVEAVQRLSSSASFAPIAEHSWYQSLLDNVNFAQLYKMINPQEWRQLLQSALRHVWAILSGSITQIISLMRWLIVLLYLIFIMIDYDNISAGFKRLIPKQYRDITLSIVADVESGMKRYFRGQSLIALIVGLLFTIGFVIVGLPLAIPVGIFVGLLNLVPYLQIFGFIPVILLCLLDHYTGGQSFWVQFGYIMIVFAVVQSLQELFLIPRIMGKAMGFRPAVILLSLSVGGSLLGILGMIIALPITSVLVSYYQKYVLRDESQHGERVGDNL